MHKFPTIILCLLILWCANCFAYDCGDQLGAPYEGQYAYHNGYYHNCTNGCYSCDGNGTYGGLYQCVEYVNRFYGLAEGLVTNNDNWKDGDAKSYFEANGAGIRGLVRYRNNLSADPPQPHDVLCFDDGGDYGHVAIVTDVTDNGDCSYIVSIIEQNWGEGHANLSMSKTSTQVGMGHYYMSDRGDYQVSGWLRFPWDLIQEEYDNNGGSSAFGSLYLQFTDNGTNYIHFYHGGYYSDNGTSGHEDCVIHNFSSGSYGDCGIVFDAFGGARRAYTVRTGFWNDGNGHGWAYLTGPTSNLGMPVTNEYAQGGGTARQDFQKGYLYYNGSSVSTPQYYPVCAPGWSGSGWNADYSYQFAMAYERNGARNDVGRALNAVHTLSGNILIQDFDYGNDDDGMIMYDQENWNGNDCATNEAYWVYGDIKSRYDNDGGVNRFGCATIDRFYYAGKWCQDFKNGSQFYRIYATGYPDWEEINPCVYQIAGGGIVDPADPPASTTYYHLVGDFDGDGYHDLGIYDQTTGDWYVALNNHQGLFVNAGLWLENFGASTDFAHLVGDFTGDGKDDVGLYKQSTGTWYVAINQGNGTFYYDGNPDLTNFGADTIYTHLVGDFNGDGKCDVGLYKQSTGTWYVAIRQTNGTFYYDENPDLYSFGADTLSTHLVGDFNGDGKCDVGLYKQSTGTWYVAIRQTNGTFYYDGNPDLYNFGASTVYTHLVGDLNGDGKCDVGLYKQSAGTWYVAIRQTNGTFYYDGNPDLYNFGASTDFTHLVGDFTGDGKDDVGLYKQSTGTWYVAVRQTNGTFYYDGNPSLSGWGTSSGAGKIALGDNLDALPVSFHLFQNYPNPFNPVTNISYSLPEAMHVRLDIFNILGQKVATLVNSNQTAGEHTVSWGAQQHASGVYFYRLQTEAAVETKKMLLLK